MLRRTEFLIFPLISATYNKNEEKRIKNKELILIVLILLILPSICLYHIRFYLWILDIILNYNHMKFFLLSFPLRYLLLWFLVWEYTYVEKVNSCFKLLSYGNIVQSEWNDSSRSTQKDLFLSGNQGIWWENQVEFNTV